MRTKAVSMVLLVVALGFLVSGCGCFYQAAKGEAPAPPPPARVEAPPPPPPPPAPAASLQDINFDFDKYNIRSQDAETLKKDYEEN